MKKFFLGRIGIILLTMVICMAVFGSFAYAAGTFNKEVPATGKILATNPDLGIYSDVACTIPVTNFTFPDVNGNETQSIVLYIKNNGNKDFTGLTLLSNLDPALGEFTANLPTVLNKGQFAGVNLGINGGIVATDTPFSCQVTIACSY